MQVFPKSRAADAAAVDLAARIIRQGGVVVFPTTGLYGLGADAFNPDAVKRVFTVKQRPAGKPVLILVRKTGDLGTLVTEVSPAAHRLVDHFWPGRVTLVFNAADMVSTLLTGGTGKIGIRVVKHPVAVALLDGVGGPITATSANRSGAPPCADTADLDPRVAAAADLILDAGLLAGGAGSTVVDVSSGTPRILREGAVPASEIHKAVKPKTEG
jgi:L-threonylcarbamoyladenylate synthase